MISELTEQQTDSLKPPRRNSTAESQKPRNGTAADRGTIAAADALGIGCRTSARTFSMDESNLLELPSGLGVGRSRQRTNPKKKISPIAAATRS